MRSTTGKNAEIAAELQNAGVQLVEMDVTSDASVNAGVAKAQDLLGGLDVVINNAGVGVLGIQELFTPEDWQRVFDVNLFGVQRVMRAVLPHFRGRGTGTVLHISSCIGRLTFPFYGPYCASKWALEALAEGYRNELSGFGIESCLVEPGGFQTSFMDALLRPSDTERAAAYGDMAHAPEAALAGFDQALEANPLQRPERVAEAVDKLLSMPFGKKPFRTVVDHMGMAEPVEQYNTVLSKVTHGIYSAFGQEQLLALNEQPA